MSEPKLGLGNLIVTLIKWSLAGTIFLWWAFVILVTWPFTTARKLFPLSQKMIRAIVWVIGVKVEAVGLDNVDPARGYVYMINHTSFLDPFVMGAVSPQFVIGIEKAENFGLPIYGWLIRWWGHVPIVREDHTKALEAIEQARQSLESGTSIAIAPEGTRSRDGRVARFKKGGFHLAREAGAQILPMSLEGLHTVNPDRKFRLKSGSVKITYHPPIDATQGTVDELIERVRTTILSAPTLEPAPPADAAQ